MVKARRGENYAPLTPEELELIRGQVRVVVDVAGRFDARIERLYEHDKRVQDRALWTKPVNRESAKRCFGRIVESEIADLMPFAVEVWDEGGRRLPLTAEQLDVAQSRALARLLRKNRVNRRRLG